MEKGVNIENQHYDCIFRSSKIINLYPKLHFTLKQQQKKSYYPNILILMVYWPQYKFYRAQKMFSSRFSYLTSFSFSYLFILSLLKLCFSSLNWTKKLYKMKMQRKRLHGEEQPISNIFINHYYLSCIL